jgi:hypothetical protein
MPRNRHCKVQSVLSFANFNAVGLDGHESACFSLLRTSFIIARTARFSGQRKREAHIKPEPQGSAGKGAQRHTRRSRVGRDRRSVAWAPRRAGSLAPSMRLAEDCKRQRLQQDSSRGFMRFAALANAGVLGCFARVVLAAGRNRRPKESGRKPGRPADD